MRLGFLEALARLLYVGFELRARREGFLVAGGGGVRGGLRGVQARARVGEVIGAVSPGRTRNEDRPQDHHQHHQAA